jgi:hypothetical protein
MRFVISVALVAAVGCGDREVEQLEKVRDAVCKCKDSKCAEDAMKLVPQKEIRAGRRAQLVAREMLDCVAKVYAAEKPTTDPDEPPR